METKWIVAVSVVIACLVSSFVARWMLAKTPGVAVTEIPEPPAPPPAAPISKPVVPATKKPSPPAAPKYSIILPATYPAYPAGMYDWFGRDQFFYRTYPDRRWVVHPWHKYRQPEPGYPDRVYRA